MTTLDKHIDDNAQINPAKLLGGGLGIGFGPPTFNDVLYVDSNATSADDSEGAGKHPTKKPFATVAYAVTQAPANTIIRVMPGHTEALVAAHEWDFAAAGIWVQGLGWGSKRPTFTFGTSTAAQVLIDQASTVLQNLLFINEIDALAAGISLAATDCRLLGIEYREDGAYEAVNVITATNAADRCLIDDITIIGEGTGDNAVAAINLASPDHFTIRNFYIHTAGSVACIDAVTACTHLMIDGAAGSFIWAEENVAIKDVTGNSTGWIKGPIAIRLATNGANIDEAIVPGKTQVYQTGGNLIGIVNAQGESELMWPGTPSTDDA